MIVFVLVTGVLNFALGLAVAWALAPGATPTWTPRLSFRWPQLRAPRLKRPRIAWPRWKGGPWLGVGLLASLWRRGKRAETPSGPPTPPAQPRTFPPADWAALLAADGVTGAGPAEGLAHVLRIEVVRYRGQLVAAQGRARQLLGIREREALGQLQQDLNLINQEWRTLVASAASWVNPQELPGEPAAREALDELLSAAQPSLEASVSALAAISLERDLDLALGDVQQELARLLDLAHDLGDQLAEWLAVWTRRCGRLEAQPEKLRQDALTGCHSRLGLEFVLDEWRKLDAPGLRLASVTLVDVDRFSRVNERLGARAGDQVIAAVADMLEELVRRGRGYDRVCRIGGQAFVLFLGDTGVRNAALALERLRQNFEAASFDHDGTQFEAAVSGAASALRPDDDVPTFLGRLRRTLQEAKRCGRNKNAIEDGDAIIPIAPTQQYPVRNRTITVK